MVDFPSGGQSETQQALHAKYMCEHLISPGCSIKATKLIVILKPPTTIQALGTSILFLDQNSIAREEQVAQIVTLAEQLTAARAVPVQKLARLAGLTIPRQH